MRLLLTVGLFCTFAFGKDLQSLEKKMCNQSTDDFNSWMRQRNKISEDERKDILKISRNILRDDKKNSCRSTAVDFMAYLSSSDKDVNSLTKHFLKGGQYSSEHETYSKYMVVGTLGDIAGRGNNKALNFLKKIIRSKDNPECIVEWSVSYVFGCTHGKNMRHGLANNAMFSLVLSERWEDLQDMVKEYENDPDLAYLVKSIKNKKSVR